MASLICCRAQEETNTRKRINGISIGFPQDFRHICHYGDTEGQNYELPTSMSSKCGEGFYSERFHLECIDLKDRNGTVLGDINNNINNDKPDEPIQQLDTVIQGPPKCLPPPIPIITQH